MTNRFNELLLYIEKPKLGLSTTISTGSPTYKRTPQPIERHHLRSLSDFVVRPTPADLRDSEDGFSLRAQTDGMYAGQRYIGWTNSGIILIGMPVAIHGATVGVIPALHRLSYRCVCLLEFQYIENIVYLTVLLPLKAYTVNH